MKQKTGNDLLLLPEPGTRPLLLMAKIEDECRQDPNSRIPEDEEGFLKRKKEELRCKKKKVRAIQKNTMRSVHSAISAKQEFREMERNGEKLNMLGEGKNHTCLNLWIKRGRKTLKIIKRIMRGLDKQMREIARNPKEFLKKNGFPEKASDDQGQE